MQTAAASSSSQNSAPLRNPPLTQSRPVTALPWILGILGLLLAATSAVAIRGVPGKPPAAKATIGEIREARIPLLEGLKEELFQLETARVCGTISIEEYDQARNALEETVKRTLLRAG